MSAALTLSLDQATLARLDDLAIERKMTREAMVQVAVSDYLDALACETPPPLQEWQAERIRRGIADADRGAFASAEEIERIASKYD